MQGMLKSDQKLSEGPYIESLDHHHFAPSIDWIIRVTTQIRPHDSALEPKAFCPPERRGSKEPKF
jgi:hypothetical protein